MDEWMEWVGDDDANGALSITYILSYQVFSKGY
jgi:hypothetical protein